MKRLISLAMPVLALLHAAVALAEPEARGEVIGVEGAVSWQPAPHAGFGPAHVGDRLFPGARVRTGERAHARLKWRNGGVLELYPLDELVVLEEDGVLIEAGKVWAEFKQKLLGPFFFKTPGAMAVVRGTILGVELRPAGDTVVEVMEGRVEVTGGHSSRLLEPGQSIIVSPQGMFGPMLPVLPSPQSALPMRVTPAVQATPTWIWNARASVRLDEARAAERLKRAPAPTVTLVRPVAGVPMQVYGSTQAAPIRAVGGSAGVVTLTQPAAGVAGFTATTRPSSGAVMSTNGTVMLYPAQGQVLTTIGTPVNASYQQQVGPVTCFTSPVMVGPAPVPGAMFVPATSAVPVCMPATPPPR